MIRATLALVFATAFAVASVQTQAGRTLPGPPTYRAPRTTTGQPDLNGFWQALNTANWDLEAHEAAAGPVLQLGAAYAVPPGAGVVVDGPIPYKPDALAMKKKYAANALREDVEVKC